MMFSRLSIKLLLCVCGRVINSNSISLSSKSTTTRGIRRNCSTVQSSSEGLFSLNLLGLIHVFN